MGDFSEWISFWITLALLLQSYVGSTKLIPNKGYSQDVCDESTFIASCPGTEVLVIQDAQYGHIAKSECTPLDTGHFGCKASALDILHEKCTGKQRCEVREEDEQLRKLNPCSKGLVVYLHVKYMCIAAQPVDPCLPINVESSPAYISSLKASSASCTGDSTRPLQLYLRAKKGQKIRLTSVNLKSPKNASSMDVGYAVDEGQDEVEALRISEREGGQLELFVSVSHEVTLSLAGAEELNFLVVFEAQGCQDLSMPNRGLLWMERFGDVTTVGCSNSDKTWTLQCTGVHWSGVIGNCTKEPEVNVEALQNVDTEVEMAVPKDIVIVIIVGLTVVLALVIVTTGYVCYKRKYQLPPPIEPTYEYEIAYNNLQRPNQPATSSADARNVFTPLLNTANGTLIRRQESGPEEPIWEQPLPAPPAPRTGRDVYTSSTLGGMRGGRTLPLQRERTVQPMHRDLTLPHQRGTLANISAVDTLLIRPENV